MTDREILEKLLEKVTNINERLDNVEQKVTDTRLHLENVTDRNLSILAENHLSLVSKLNDAVKVSDKTLLYEIQVNYLREDVAMLKKEIEELKNRIA